MKYGKALNSDRVVFRDQNSNTLAVAYAKEAIYVPKNPWLAIASNVVVTSAKSTGHEMRRAANYVPRKPQIVIASFALIEVQAPRVKLHTIFKVSTQLRNDFLEKKAHAYQGRLFRGFGYTEVGYERFYCRY